MITIMRKHHKVLMIFITALVCISFSWYWNKTHFAQIGNGSIGKIYYTNVSPVEHHRNPRPLGSHLALRHLIRELTMAAPTEREAYDTFSWILLVLRHETEPLGLNPT